MSAKVFVWLLLFPNKIFPKKESGNKATQQKSGDNLAIESECLDFLMLIHKLSSIIVLRLKLLLYLLDFTDSLNWKNIIL